MHEYTPKHLMGQPVHTLYPSVSTPCTSLRLFSEILYTCELPGPPTVLQLFYNDGGDEGEQVLYGTLDGKVGVMNIGGAEPSAGNLDLNFFFDFL